MPTHAILGATGGAGSAVLHNLLKSKISNLTINILVRSKDKLLSLIPNLETNITINIFTGSFTNEQTLLTCLQDAEIIYQCISAPGPSKTNTTSQDVATAIIAALTTLRPKSPPTLLLNRSSALNPSIKVPISVPFFYFLKWSLDSIYSDVSAAASMYTDVSTTGDQLLRPIFVDAPNLFHPYSPGTRTGYEIFLTGDTTLGVNYADFGAAMVEIAERKEKFWGKGVGVRATGDVVPAWGPNIRTLASGVWCRLSPF